MFEKRIAGQVVKKVLGTLAKESKTTIFGFIAAALLAQNITWKLVFVGDPNEIGNVAAAIAVALLGWFTKDREKGA